MSLNLSEKQEYHIRELKTRSVTLYPKRAQVIRDLKGITLQPGQNQIVIQGLSPLIDDQSIRVEGTGNGTITDLQVESVPNKESYSDVYESDSEDAATDTDDDSSDDEDESLKAIQEKINSVQNSIKEEEENLNSASVQLDLLKHHSYGLKDLRNDAMGDTMSTYRTQRASVYDQCKIATAKSQDLKEDLKKLNKEKSKLSLKIEKSRRQARKSKDKAAQKKRREQQKIRDEKIRLKEERMKFWPTRVYNVTISLELPIGTPMSSRRNSMDTLVQGGTGPKDHLKATKTETQLESPSEINICLSYITWDASWTPRYDLNLSSGSSTASLDYSAELSNASPEIWSDTKVILSTSQTSFEGLDGRIPTLTPWHLRLFKNSRTDMSKEDRVILSDQEAQHRQANAMQTNKAVKKKISRHGPANPPVPPNALVMAAPRARMMVSHAAPASNPYAAPSGGLFGASNNTFNIQQQQQQQQQQLQQQQSFQQQSALMAAHQMPLPEDDDDDSDTTETPLDGPDARLDYEEGSWEETGLTTTYELPGIRTLKASTSNSKQKIARIQFTSVEFSHVVVPKLRSVAFLKAKLRNSSKITLLRGPAGLTLDGSFLGQTTVPRCSAGGSISLSLGADPSIQVHYPKPTVHRSQSGVFTKEDSSVFTRTILLTNTKHNAPVELLVQDQIPQSEDERLRIEIMQPKGLKTGTNVHTGWPATESNPTSTGNNSAASQRSSVYGSSSSSADAKWGSAVATAKKLGEVSWSVKLKPGASCKLLLEYECAYPVTETLTNV